MAQSVSRNLGLAALEKELLARRVGYDGEEVGICHILSLSLSLSFAQVLPALPPKEHGGSIPVDNFLSEGTKHWLNFPEKLVVEDVGQVLPRLQGRMRIVPEDVNSIAHILVERGVYQWLAWDDVAVFREEKILNGLFGVPKTS